MGQYPKATRAATLKCIDCNSPVIETVTDDYVCIDCGESPIEHRDTDASLGA